MNKTEAAQLVAMLTLHYPSAPFSRDNAQAYAGAIQDLPFEAAREAIMRLRATCKFLPSVAEIRSVAIEVQHGPQRSGAEAWGDVVAAIRRVGSYGVPRFDDPGVAECVRIMDWRGLCLSENDAADRARFIELYDGLQTRARQDLAAGRALPPARGFAALPPPKPRHEPIAEPWEPKGLAMADLVKRLPPAPFDAEDAQRRAEHEQARQRQMARELLAKERT